MENTTDVKVMRNDPVSINNPIDVDELARRKWMSEVTANARYAAMVNAIAPAIKQPGDDAAIEKLAQVIASMTVDGSDHPDKEFRYDYIYYNLVEVLRA